MKRTMKTSSAIAIVGCVLLIGCHKDIREYCEAMAECEGGNDEDEKACVEDAKGDRKEAAEYDCKEEFDEWMECMAKNGQCSDYSYDGYTDKYFEAEDDCEGKEEVLEDCIESASAWY